MNKIELNISLKPKTAETLASCSFMNRSTDSKIGNIIHSTVSDYCNNFSGSYLETDKSIDIITTELGKLKGKSKKLSDDIISKIRDDVKNNPSKYKSVNQEIQIDVAYNQSNGRLIIGSLTTGGNFDSTNGPARAIKHIAHAIALDADFEFIFASKTFKKKNLASKIKIDNISHVKYLDEIPNGDKALKEAEEKIKLLYSDHIKSNKDSLISSVIETLQEIYPDSDVRKFLTEKTNSI